MRILKKLTALALALFTVSGIAVSGLGVSAEDASTTESLDSYLVTHYDFKGETLEEALTDKALAGSVKDNLTVKNGATDTVADICTWDSVKGTLTNDKKQARVVQAANSADIQAIANGNATVMLRYQLKQFDTSGANAPLFNMRSSFTPANTGLSLYVSNNRQFFSNCCNNSTNKVANYFYTDQQTITETDVYMNVALVIGETDSNGLASVDLYYCYGEPVSTTDWTKGKTQSIYVGCNGSKTSPFGLFTMPGESNTPTSIVTYDDIRIYNRALTLQQVNSVFVENSFDTVHAVGVQKKVNADKTTDVRFLAVTDTLDADAVGFRVDCSYKDSTGQTVTMPAPKDYQTTTVYQSVLAAGSTVSATTYNSSYIAALVVSGIPEAYTDVTFTVTPYRLIGETKIWGDTVTVALSDLSAG